MNGVVYLWHCSDVSACYIGSSVNFPARVSLHRYCFNRGDKSPLYESMRTSGGIDKWRCDVLEDVEGTRQHLRYREQHHINTWGAPLLNKNGAIFNVERRKKYAKDYYKDYYQRNKEAYKVRYENRKSNTIVNGGGPGT